MLSHSRSDGVSKEHATNVEGNIGDDFEQQKLLHTALPSSKDSNACASTKCIPFWTDQIKVCPSVCWRAIVVVVLAAVLITLHLIANGAIQLTGMPALLPGEAGGIENGTTTAHRSPTHPSETHGKQNHSLYGRGDTKGTNLNEFSSMYLGDGIFSVEPRPNERIERISIIGERHSGTNWITNELARCFNNSLEVNNRLVRYKHWFQDESASGPSDRRPTLVVSMFRDPMDWTEAMRIVPHHSPEHLRLDWKTFVTKKWTMPRPERDLEIEDKASAMCQERFRYDQIVSCIPGRKPADYVPIPGEPMYSGHSPQYELRDDGSGEPYESVVQLRRDKILSFLRVTRWGWIDAVLAIRYEDVLERGTASLLEEISRRTGAEYSCASSAKQARASRKLDEDFVIWMNRNVDWTVEGLIGYKRREV